MGFFDLFKRKEAEKEKDFNVLSGSGMVDYIRSNLKEPTDENVLKVLEKVAQPDADQEHLTAEGDLPWGWHTLNKEFTEGIGGEFTYFLNKWIDSKSKSPEERYSALKSFVLYLEDAGQLCKSKGECFEFWYYKILTSQDYISKRKAELHELEENLQFLQEMYILKQNNMVGLEEKIINLLKENDGIIQSEFIKLFDASVKDELSKILYYWEKAGMIERIKQGRSYILHFKGDIES